MLEEGNFTINNCEFNRKIIPTDWRYSATIVGLARYLDYHDLPYEMTDLEFYYNYEDIDETNEDFYADYIQYKYDDILHHKILLNIILGKDESIDEEDEDTIKKLLEANTIMKKTFKGIKASELEKIENIIEKNSTLLTLETYKNAKRGYRKFCNPNRFRCEPSNRCRILGYTVDAPRKDKSLTFGFDNKKRDYNDYLEFDYIPFAFTNTSEAVFVNNNQSVSKLIATNDDLESRFEMAKRDDQDPKLIEMFFLWPERVDFLNYDVEVIVKNYETEYYETEFFRKESIEIIKEIAKELDTLPKGDKDNRKILKTLKRFIKLNEKTTIYYSAEVKHAIVNLLELDPFINFLLKRKEEKASINRLITINEKIYEKLYFQEDNMDERESKVEQTKEQNHNEKDKEDPIERREKNKKSAISTAMTIRGKMESSNRSNKLSSYRHQLIGALVGNNYERFIEIMLQLSSYTETPLSFLNDLIQNFEENKNLAYIFVNTLNDYKYEENKEEKNE